MSSVAFTYSEAKLSERLGVSRTHLKSIRDRRLTPDSDWKKVAGEVVLSPSGVKRLWRSLQARPAGFDLAACLISAPAKKNGATGNGANGSHGPDILLGHPSMPIPVLMMVIRVCSNPSLVLAQQTEGLDRRIQPVWVGKNENFGPGMRIKVVPKPDAPAMWRFHGVLPQRRYTPDEWERRQRAGMQG